MTAQSSSDATHLPLDVRRRIAELCEHFDRAWNASPNPRIEDFLVSDAPAKERSELLKALLEVEVYYRKQAGTTIHLDEYLQRFPGQSDAVHAAFRAQDTPVLPTVRDRAPQKGGASPPPTVQGYEILGELGHGGMGDVWHGRDQRLKREVAVKVMRAELSGLSNLDRRFVDEAQVASQLQHPAIPPVHELGELPDGRPFFTMKLVKGHTLADLLRARSGPADDLPRFLAVFEQVCQALAYSHSKGVIHRDLKPANVMVGAFGEVQVMDWGLAKVLTADVPVEAPADAAERVVETEGRSPTQVGMALGTYAYMPPEQARGEIEHLDRRCDVFGLGAILCEMLTGLPPYVGTANEVRSQSQAGQVATARERLGACGAEGELVELAARCLSARPEERPADAGAVATALTAYLTGVQERLRQAELARAAAEARAAEAKATAAAEHKARRRTLALALASLALVAVAAVGGLWVQRQAAERHQAIESALAKAVALREQARWGAAQAVLEQVRQVLGNRSGDLRRRLDGAVAELDLVNRLDAIRLRRATLVEGKFDDRTAAQDFATAFREARLGEVGDEEEAVAARVRASSVRGPLVAALDSWASVAKDRDEGPWLLKVVRLAAGPDSWADRFRDPVVWHDRQALQALADEAVRDDGVKVAQLSPQLLQSFGVLLMASDADALPLLRTAQRRYPDDFWLNLELGNALRTAKHVEEAIGYFRVAVALRPDAAAAHNNLGAALGDKKDQDGAVAAYRRAIELDPKLAYAHAGLGTALYYNKDVVAAIAEFHQAIALDPNLASAHNNLGVALHATGNADGAIGEYTKAIAIDPKYADAHNNLGAALRDRGDLEGAIAQYQTAIDNAPRFVAAHNNLGLALHAKKDLKGAIAQYRKAIAQDPEFTSAHNNLGLALYESDDPRGAVAEYRKAIALAPKLAKAHYNLGIALADMGEGDEAIAEYRTAIHLDREYAPAHTMLGRVLAEKNDLDGAIAEHQLAIKLDPKLVNAHINLGQALLEHGRFEESRTAFRHCLELLPPGEPLRPPISQRLQRCDSLIALDAKLTAVLAGKAEPADAAERFALGQVCQQYKRRHATAVRFYADAFAANPKVAADPRQHSRYNAACSAALAAAGQADDAKQLTDKARRTLRQQALSWLRDDLAAYVKLAEHADPATRQFVRQQMQHWRQDTDLASVRDQAALARLPDDERPAWGQLWDEVTALLCKLPEKN